MTLRISTAGLYAQGLAGLQQKQAQLARTQQELVSDRKLLRGADDPAAMAQSQRLDHALASLAQNGRNANLLQNRLRLQETALADVGSELARAQELALQANTPTLSDADRTAIAQELRAIRAQVLAIANRDDGTGRRLFAGNRDGVVPFVDAGGAVAYAGDDGRNLVEIAPGLGVADTDPGSEVFLRVRTGDGIVRGSAGAANTGSGVLQSSAVTDHAAWNGGSLQVEFTAADAYRVLDGDGNELATGSYAAGGSISAGGVQLVLTGAPAAGDTFTVERAPAKDIFATLQDLADALDAPAASPQDQARRGNAVGAAIGDLATAQEHMLSLRSGTGTRLATLDGATDTRDAGEISLTESLSQLRDLDYAEAASRLALQMTALDAAQQTMLKLQGMSLFQKM
jgi:flagellar hook-associated protein 3 FlgL